MMRCCSSVSVVDSSCWKRFSDLRQSGVAVGAARLGWQLSSSDRKLVQAAGCVSRLEQQQQQQPEHLAKPARRG